MSPLALARAVNPLTQAVASSRPASVSLGLRVHAEETGDGGREQKRLHTASHNKIRAGKKYVGRLTQTSGR